MEGIILKVGKNHTLGDVVSGLFDRGYERDQNISLPGTFEVFGDTLRIFAINEENPIRIDFFGDRIESIFPYDRIENRIISKLSQIEIIPNRIILQDGAVVKPSDFIVHEDYGIGRFRRLEIKIVEGKRVQYANLEYRNGDTLYVPTSAFLKLSVYIGPTRKSPRLSKLGTSTWKNNYHKVYENVLKMAKELLIIYANRAIAKKPARILYPEWEKEIVNTFGFGETPDQEKAIGDVYADLLSTKPMDRLVCGDVGFGKTEIAIRAAAQSVANGYQVIVLVPTTILAEQHAATLIKRFASLPVKIAKLSRFVNEKEAKQTALDCERGNVDILVGTHQVLHRNIKFKNLGMLVIDEEQKFGVKDKEKIKNLRSNIDVLSMTATPIPRTMFLALSGIWDISQISSVPLGRMPVKTQIEKYSKELVISHINREMARGGQVYYLHNRVATINPVANFLRKEFPNRKVAIAHGQMREDVLAETMGDFTQNKIDILVCSTIIENGLDLSNVNTLIVEESEKFGLSQLYQIRGRVGRSKRQAYALFLYNSGKLTNDATRRLKSLAENSELGTGYNIALSDLEIRGGGNVLGREQHGNMETIGLLLYSKLLKLAIEKIKKESGQWQREIASS